MPTPDTSAFDTATTTTLESGGDGDGVARGHIHDGWDIGGNANGGYLLALAASGMRQIAGRPDPVTITAHYLSPGVPGEAEIAGTVVKSGKRFATVSGSLTSNGRTVIQVLGTFGDLGAGDPHGVHVVHGAPPSLPPPDQCRARVGNPNVPIPMMDKLDIRLHPEHVKYMTGEARMGRAEMAGWFSFADGRPIDTLSLLLIADAFPPAVFNLDIPPGWVPTVELTVHVRATPAPGPVSCVFRSRFVHSGMMEEDGEVWDSRGTLVALSRQLALLPR